MFFTESEKRTYALKPMNCPGHVQVFNHGLHSYRDLPIRYGEFGACHRNEPSGALHGILRVRGFTQDDGHIFCTEDQIEAEVTAFHAQAMAGLRRFRLHRRRSSRSRCARSRGWATTPPGTRPRRRCARPCAPAGVEWEELPGEGAFYGPKIEYHLQGRASAAPGSWARCRSIS